MDISIVTDELTGDPETAFQLGLEWGVTRFELRGVHETRVPRISNHARQRLLRAIERYGVSITAVSPGLFKIPFPATERIHSNLIWMDAEFADAQARAQALLADHLENLLPESIAFAQSVGARYLIAFSFGRNGAPQGPAPQGVIDAITHAAETAAAAGVELLIENEEGHFADTGLRSANLIERIRAPIGLNWDPANARIDGDTPFPDGYEAAKSLIRNVHYKDVRCFADGGWEIAAEGEVDWTGQISALIRDRYSGAIAVEPHLSPPVEATRDAVRKLQGLVSKAF